MKSSKCSTPYCRKKRAHNRRFCWGCVSRKKRAANPILYAYQTLRDNAKRRGKVFELTFEYFRDWVLAEAYMQKKGREVGKFHIDRDKHHLGYIPGNLKIRESSENARKAYIEKLCKPFVIEGDITIGPTADIEF